MQNGISIKKTVILQIDDTVHILNRYNRQGTSKSVGAAMSLIERSTNNTCDCSFCFDVHRFVHVHSWVSTGDRHWNR
jgi:hypothetical protein